MSVSDFTTWAWLLVSSYCFLVVAASSAGQSTSLQPW